jgi:hypothetical protein
MAPLVKDAEETLKTSHPEFNQLQESSTCLSRNEVRDRIQTELQLNI